MKTNGRAAKISKPFVPSGAPYAPKGKNDSSGRIHEKKQSRPMFQVDNPMYSELDWLNGADEPEQPEVPVTSRKSGAIRKVKLHGFAAVAEAPLEAQRAEEEDNILSKMDFHATTDATERPDLKEFHFSPSLQIKTSPTTRLLPRDQLAEEWSDGGGNGESGRFRGTVSIPSSVKENLQPKYMAPESRTIPEIPQLKNEVFNGRSSLTQEKQPMDVRELQHGTIPFDFRDRNRVDIIIRLQTPFQDAGYSLACSLDVPFCHAVVRAKLGAEAVVTLIRTQEEGNTKGRLDWIAAGKPVL
ncbi:WIAG-tail domain [Paenibacillus herberti]|nr:WIAG-tail domain [Paenibacillus herberti]